MGAMAISVLAGSLLIINASNEPYLDSILPFIKGFTIFYWATGSWWIPMLLILGVWRHIFKRIPLEYDPLYWGAVFPLGMYAACTHEMKKAMGFDFLGFLPHVFLYISFIAWLAAFAGLVYNITKCFKVQRT
jgi:tellurite resistance protein TehA-like permease